MLHTNNLMICRDAVASYLLILYRSNQKPHSCQSGSGFSSQAAGFESRSGRAPAWILKNFRASIELDAGAKLRFSVSDRAFVIAGIKQREHLV